MKKLFLVLFMMTIVIMPSCKRDYLNVSNGVYVQLNHEESHQIDAESESMITYKSSNNYHAEVSSQGLVKANYVGKADISLTNENGDEKMVTIDVVPVSNLYPEPNISIGETESSVRSKFGLPDVSNDGTYMYENYSFNAPYLMIIFENGVVESYAVLVNPNQVENLMTFLNERYAPMGFTDDYVFYMNALSSSEATKTIGVGVLDFGYELYIMVGYIPYNKSDIEVFKDKISKIIRMQKK